MNPSRKPYENRSPSTGNPSSSHKPYGKKPSGYQSAGNKGGGQRAGSYQPVSRAPLAPEHTSPLELTVPEDFDFPVVEVKAPVRNPLLYRKRLGKFDVRARPGDLVRLELSDGAHFGYGMFNSRAETTVRVLNRTDEIPTADWWRRQLQQACRLRTDLLKLPEATSACRVIHAESDGFPGLVIDRYETVLSAECFSLGMYRRAQAILEMLQQEWETPHWFLTAAPHTEKHEGFVGEPRSSADCPLHVTIQEAGTQFRVQFEEGHKTGFFCDQRENRQRIAALCAGKSVLDLCCYSGGFSLQAARLGNAADVTGVDLDETAIALAKTNAKLNKQKIRFVHADVFPYMRDMLQNGNQYDVVILDPPKLINSRDEFDEGRKKYFDLNRLACQLVKPGGLLLSCSCSGLMPAEEFAKTIAGALPSEAVGRFLYKWGAAADHPVATYCPETEYLKAYLVQIDHR